MAVAGVVLGSLLWSLVTRRFPHRMVQFGARCGQPRIGAVLMGFGGTWR